MTSVNARWLASAVEGAVSRHRHGRSALRSRHVPDEPAGDTSLYLQLPWDATPDSWRRNVRWDRWLEAGIARTASGFWRCCAGGCRV